MGSPEGDYEYIEDTPGLEFSKGILDRLKLEERWLEDRLKEVKTSIFYCEGSISLLEEHDRKRKPKTKEKNSNCGWSISGL